MTPYPRHFHVVFDVVSSLLNPSINYSKWPIYKGKLNSPHDILYTTLLGKIQDGGFVRHFCFHFGHRSHDRARILDLIFLWLFPRAPRFLPQRIAGSGYEIVCSFVFFDPSPEFAILIIVKFKQYYQAWFPYDAD